MKYFIAKNKYLAWLWLKKFCLQIAISYLYIFNNSDDL